MRASSSSRRIRSRSINRACSSSGCWRRARKKAAWASLARLRLSDRATAEYERPWSRNRRASSSLLPRDCRGARGSLRSLSLSLSPPRDRGSLPLGRTHRLHRRGQQSALDGARNHACFSSAPRARQISVENVDPSRSRRMTGPASPPRRRRGRKARHRYVPEARSSTGRYYLPPTSGLTAMCTIIVNPTATSRSTRR